MAQETITPKVAMYAVTKALSHQGLNAINKVKAQTTNAERKPPIKYPAPTTKTIVAVSYTHLTLPTTVSV